MNNPITLLSLAVFMKKLAFTFTEWTLKTHSGELFPLANSVYERHFSRHTDWIGKLMNMNRKPLSPCYLFLNAFLLPTNSEGCPNKLVLLEVKQTLQTSLSFQDTRMWEGNLSWRIKSRMWEWNISWLNVLELALARLSLRSVVLSCVCTYFLFIFCKCPLIWSNKITFFENCT